MVVVFTVVVVVDVRGRVGMAVSTGVGVGVGVATENSMLMLPLGVVVEAVFTTVPSLYTVTVSWSPEPSVFWTEMATASFVGIR